MPIGKLKLAETDIEKLREENRKRLESQQGSEYIPYQPESSEPKFTPSQEEAVDSIKKELNRPMFEKLFGALGRKK